LFVIFISPLVSRSFNFCSGLLLFKAKYMCVYNWLRGVSGIGKGSKPNPRSTGLRSRGELQKRWRAVRRSAPSPALSSPAQFAIESWIYGKLNRRLFWVCATFQWSFLQHPCDAEGRSRDGCWRVGSSLKHRRYRRPDRRAGRTQSNPD
jgi:hypothetical protein